MKLKAAAALAALGIVSCASTAALAGTEGSAGVLRDPNTGTPVGCRAEVLYADNEQGVPSVVAGLQCNHAWSAARIVVQARFDGETWTDLGRVWTLDGMDARELIQWGGELCPIESPCVPERGVFKVKDGVRSNGRIDGRTVIPIDPNVQI